MFTIGSLAINEEYILERIKPNLLFLQVARKLNAKYKDIKTKQFSQVTYLGCVLNKTLSGQP